MRVLPAVLTVALLLVPIAMSSDRFQPRQKSILVVTATEGFRHDSIETAEITLGKIASDLRFRIDFARTSEDLATKMSADGLQNYDVIVFANTTGDLPLPDRQAFIDWVRSAHGFVGVHSAADTYHGYPPYLDMLGAEFDTHGDQTTVIIDVERNDHPATEMLGERITVFDEIYIFKRFTRSEVNMLLSLDREPNSGEPGFFPIAWWKPFGRGRVFYTALGHREDVWESEWFRQHLEGAISWAASNTRRRPVVR